MPKDSFFKLRSPDGAETVWAASADGYPDWTVLVETTRLPGPHEDHDGKAWKVDKKRQRRAEKAAEHRVIGREAYVHKVLTTLFPGLTITAAQMEELFPDVEPTAP